LSQRFNAAAAAAAAHSLIYGVLFWEPQTKHFQLTGLPDGLQMVKVGLKCTRLQNQEYSFEI
jgi:hypothetical protein